MGLYSRADTKKFLRERVARPASAGVIVMNEADEALLLKAHYKPYWSFPGGWIEKDQTPLSAALRELAEETGLVLEPQQVTFAFMVNRFSDIMQSYQFIFQSRQAIAHGDDIRLQASEIADWKFVSRQQVLAEPTQYGGAVVAWAEANDVGYYEKALRID